MQLPRKGVERYVSILKKYWGCQKSWSRKFPQRPTCSISPAYIKAVQLGLAWRNQSSFAHVITLSSSKLVVFVLNMFFWIYISRTLFGSIWWRTWKLITGLEQGTTSRRIRPQARILFASTFLEHNFFVGEAKKNASTLNPILWLDFWSPFLESPICNQIHTVNGFDLYLAEGRDHLWGSLCRWQKIVACRCQATKEHTFQEWEEKQSIFLGYTFILEENHKMH